MTKLSVVAVAAVVALGCGAKPDDSTPPDASICLELSEAACNAQVGCYAQYTTSNEAGTVGGDFVSCSAGSATCTLPTGCGIGGVGCPQGLTLAFTLANAGVCDTGVTTACVRPETCSP
ncbi:MAG: hypothetical protein ABI591_04490 [Kofleriaceae bacterium]